MTMYLLVDFYSTLTDYFNNYRKLLIDAPKEKIPNFCPICYDDCIEAIELPCSHIVCYKCLMRCASIKALCPMCPN